MDIDEAALDKTLKVLKERLIRARQPQGCWRGRLSGSALATAVAVFALSLVDKTKYASLIRNGLGWLIDNQNPDGGWGDTVLSLSNISTTMLCWSALAIAEQSNRSDETAAKAESRLVDFAGSIEPDVLAGAVDRQYGRDRSFSAPILTMCALAGRLGPAEQAWRKIKPLPFELAIFPHKFFKLLKLSVVSYALPALIAIGQANYYHRKPINPVTRLIRHLSRRKTLTVLGNIQPENGGFLEAAPLTAFVVMSLAACGQKDNEVVSKGAEFLVGSARDDGSWPIDTNLATWVTTLSVNALAAAPDFERLLPAVEREKIRRMLLTSQYRHEHPYTHSAPGGWGWTALPGAVPDADDTAGVLIALANLGPADETVAKAAIAGIEWLLGIQNSDGGIPTFCRGWTNLPFDRSAPDLTAHALAAFGAWFDRVPALLQRRIDSAVKRGLEYLDDAQKQDGSWVPLWFGNESAPNQENPVYGTARVLTGLHRLPCGLAWARATMLTRAVKWLVSVQNADGGWGGDKSVGSSVEETALAVDALVESLPALDAGTSREARSALAKGVSCLVKQTGAAGSIASSPIGLYFAKLWYFEDLYPLIFAVSALQKFKNLCQAT
ncbi:MAG: squalene--hopene cyclase [Phycisphaerae bacterium]|nr:squalene--hopene cyclase [Phycisphaerae bacterium]